jgi:hypothetical protein
MCLAYSKKATSLRSKILKALHEMTPFLNGLLHSITGSSLARSAIIRGRGRQAEDGRPAAALFVSQRWLLLVRQRLDFRLERHHSFDELLLVEFNGRLGWIEVADALEPAETGTTRLVEVAAAYEQRLVDG